MQCTCVLDIIILLCGVLSWIHIPVGVCYADKSIVNLSNKSRHQLRDLPHSSNAHCPYNCSHAVILYTIHRGARTDYKNSIHLTPLLAAIRYTQPEAVRILLRRGADVMAKDRLRNFIMQYFGQWRLRIPRS